MSHLVAIRCRRFEEYEKRKKFSRALYSVNNRQFISETQTEEKKTTGAK